MDTLIDKREFPQEMQEKAPQKKKNKFLPFLILIFVVVVLALAAFFYAKITKVEQVEVEEFTKPQPLTIEEERQAVQEIQNAIVPLEKNERDQKLEVFFN